MPQFVFTRGIPWESVIAVDPKINVDGFHFVRPGHPRRYTRGEPIALSSPEHQDFGQTKGNIAVRAWRSSRAAGKKENYVGDGGAARAVGRWRRSNT